LHYLWWWALDYAPNGDTSSLAPAEIAAAAEWPGNIEQFVLALKNAGWMNEDGKLHDWGEYRLHYDLMLERKERQRDQVRERVRRFRQKKRNGNRLDTQSNAPTVPTVPTLPKQQNQVLSPKNGENGKLYETKTDLQKIVLGFKLKMGNPKEDREWDKVYFPRFSKPARELLALFRGDVGHCLDCIEKIVDKLERDKLTWTPETIVKHAANWQNGR